jgi:hypothetical protein
MTTMQTPSEDQAHFDAICAPIDDWETLPTGAGAAGAAGAPRGPEDEPDHEEHVASLDRLILAGLVSPY